MWAVITFRKIFIEKIILQGEKLILSCAQYSSIIALTLTCVLFVFFLSIWFDSLIPLKKQPDQSERPHH